MKSVYSFLAVLLLLGCSTSKEIVSPQEQDYWSLIGFERFTPISMKIEMPIPKERNIEDVGIAMIVNGKDFQFSVDEIINKKNPDRTLESVLEKFCTFSKKNPNGTVTIQYEVQTDAGRWIRFDTNCPQGEGMRDIMLARIGTGTYLLTLLDGTSDEMAEKIEKAFLQIRKSDSATYQE